MEEAYKILEYLPIRFRTQANHEYINFLWESFVVNYQNKKYIFAYIAFHMIFMSAIYSILWKIKCCNPTSFDHALIGLGRNRKDIKKDNANLFSLSAINETTILEFLRLLDFEFSEIKEFKKIVDDRNNMAHSNGEIFLKDQVSLDEKITTMLEYLQKIQEKCPKMLEDMLIGFLQNHWDIDTNQYDNLSDEIDEIFIPDNILSRVDLNLILEFDITRLEQDPHYDQMVFLFEEIKEAYTLEEA